MDIKNLTTFIQVAELRSFSRAADKLGYAQSTVSFQIRQLEQELGVPLFERINHTVTLTDHGSRLLQSAHRIDEVLQHFVNETATKENIQGKVRLAMADSLCIELVRRVFPVLHARCPGITLECMTAGTADLFRLLNHNEADLVFTLDTPIYDTNYVILQENRIGVQLVCAPEHPFAHREQVTLEQLVREPFRLTEKGMSYRRLMDEQLAVRALEVQPALVSSNTDLLCSLVRQNAGISLLPDYVTRPYAEQGELCYVHVPEIDIQVWAQLVHHRDKWVSEPMRVMIDLLRGCPLGASFGKNTETM